MGFVSKRLTLSKILSKNIVCSSFQVGQGSISSTFYIHTAFTLVGPKNVRIQSSNKYLFTLLGSTGAKTARRTLMKLTPGLTFINHATYWASSNSCINLALSINANSFFSPSYIVHLLAFPLKPSALLHYDLLPLWAISKVQTFTE